MLTIATIIAHYDVDGNVTDDLLKLTIELKKGHVRFFLFQQISMMQVLDR